MRTLLLGENVRNKLGRYVESGSTAAKLICLALVIGSFGCSMATEEDEARLAKLKDELGTKYEFSVEYDLYLNVRVLHSDEPSREEGIDLFKRFWFDDDKPRTNSAYVYLNIYNRRNEFRFQVSWDPQKKQLAFSNQDHY